MATIATEATVYRGGNAWQQARYAFMAAVTEQAGISRYGASRQGTLYKHLLHPGDALHNFLGDADTLRAVHARFAGHKAGDLQRALTNTVASQPCCFNLFVPLQQDHALASRLFTHLLAVPVSVVHIEIEFTPNKWSGPPGFERHSDETIGDQSDIGGTDADVAVFYETAEGGRGVVLIEFKYIEAEFSICSSYKSRSKGPRIRAGCDAADWYEQRIASNLSGSVSTPDCGYLKYGNWRLLETSTALNAAAVKAQLGCPFKGSLNQLWRNMLLAERVAAARKLDDLHFWVLSPVQNTFLWRENGVDAYERMRGMLTLQGKAAFRRLELDKDVVLLLEGLASTAEQHTWLERFRGRYLPEGGVR
ncbi:MAG: hypothetical protein IPO12_01820 [Flavobacteriales bacterium]|nr:hypothetical protein [Flavobacteriales bacterium]